MDYSIKVETLYYKAMVDHPGLLQYDITGINPYQR
jgi:hypothetical protein